MFEHYLPNKNERAIVAPKSKFLQLNTALIVKRMHGILFNVCKLRGPSCVIYLHYIVVAYLGTLVKNIYRIVVTLGYFSH